MENSMENRNANIDDRKKIPIRTFQDLNANYLDVVVCREAIQLYDTSSGQLYNLRKGWQNFHKNDH
jgi:hypothetical protein